MLSYLSKRLLYPVTEYEIEHVIKRLKANCPKVMMKSNWFLMRPSFVAIDGVIRNQLDICATGCNTQR
jgi:hypothetical protein